MPRARLGSARTRKKARVRRLSKGYRGVRKNYRLAKEAIVRAGVYAYRDRRNRKRDFRSLWITRLSAACEEHGLKYSRFIDGCKRANIILNRKMLSELAIHDPPAFTAVVDFAKKALESKQAA